MITIGFNPATYTVAESAGSVNVTVNILNGTLARDVRVLLMTALTDGTATGIEFLKSDTLLWNVNYVCQYEFHGKHFSYIYAAMVDYVVTSSDLIFNVTTSSQTMRIPIIEDNIYEGSETITVTLTSTDPAAIVNPPSASITIEDDDGK